MADEDGAPVGFGSAWINAFHPHALYVSLNVHPAYRRRGVGARLLRALNAYNADRLPLQACTWATSAAGTGFLERQGFQAVRRTYEPILHIADVDVDGMRSTADSCADHGYTLLSLAELAQAPTHEAKLAAPPINRTGSFDSTDPWAMINLGAFPFCPAPCWLTFQRTSLNESL